MTDALAGADVTPITKRIMLDVNASVTDPDDNIESINESPELEIGNRSVVLVSEIPKLRK